MTQETLSEIFSCSNKDYEAISFYDQIILKSKKFSLEDKLRVFRHTPTHKFFVVYTDNIRYFMVEVEKMGSVKTNLIFVEKQNIGM